MGISENTKDYLILLVVCLFAFFINNNVIPADLMESRNLATAQEMVKEGNYLIPTMNGELRLAKPPLPTWVSAGIELILPGRLTLHRSAAGAMGVLMVFFLYFFTLTLTNKRHTALIAGLILATSYNVIMMGRTASWDIYCHSFMLGAIYFITSALQHTGAQWKMFLWSGLFMGLSFLSKGPVAFFALLLPFLISYFIIYKPSLKGKLCPLAVMVIICLLVSFWWPIYILIFHKETFLSIANKESSSWIDRNVRPWHYYRLFFVESGIWSTFWITSLLWFHWKKKVEDKKAYLFSVLWTFAALVLLSIVPEKKTRYLLPMLIPGAINIAFFIDYCTRSLMSRGEKNLFRINVGIISLILFMLPAALYFIFFKHNFISIPLYILISVTSIILGIFILYYLFNHSGIKALKVFYMIIGVMIFIEGLCIIPVGNLFINEERHSIREVREIKELSYMPFFHLQGEDIRMEIVYEANRIIRPLDISNDSIVRSNTPFVLISQQPADTLLKGRGFSIRQVDLFDNNWRQREHKKFNLKLVNNVAVIQSQ